MLLSVRQNGKAKENQRNRRNHFLFFSVHYSTKISDTLLQSDICVLFGFCFKREEEEEEEEKEKENDNEKRR
jgi:6,7-dimethyl-8-ribityllumazine synthase